MMASVKYSSTGFGRRSSPVSLNPRSISPKSKRMADMADRANMNRVPSRESSAASAGSIPRSLTRPRSISTRNNIISADLSPAPTKYSISLTNSSSSVSTDSEPVSITPQEKVSRYAVSTIKAYRNYLSRTLIVPEGIHSNERGDLGRPAVTSMKYTDSNLELGGYYHGQVDKHSTPDGIGILCCHDGQLLDGKWEKGQFMGGEKGKSFNDDPMKSVSRDINGYLLKSDDTSTCSSLSASVAGKFFRYDISELKTQRIPSHIYLDAPSKSVHWVDTNLYFRKNVIRRKYEP